MIDLNSLAPDGTTDGFRVSLSVAFQGTSQAAGFRKSGLSCPPFSGSHWDNAFPRCKAT